MTTTIHWLIESARTTCSEPESDSANELVISAETLRYNRGILREVWGDGYCPDPDQDQSQVPRAAPAHSMPVRKDSACG